MDLSNVKSDLINIVTNIAPSLGSALGGPAGGLVGTLIAHLFRANPNDSDDIVQKIKDDPESEQKLKELEYEHQEELTRLQVQSSALKVLSEIITMN